MERHAATPSFPRFLGATGLRGTPVLRADVLVVGGGIAGAAAALAAAEQGASVLVLVKGDFTETNTNQAQGGMAAVLGPGDSFDLHLEDTVRVGAGLTDRETARRIIQDGPGIIEWLRANDTRFDLDEHNALELSREGGHSVERVVHADGDSTGREMQRSLSHLLATHPDIDIRTHSFVRDLLIREGRCVGATVITPTMELAVEAGATVIASGGAGQIYRETTNPIGACGDGVALAFRAGARIRDMEFVQFHPTTLYIAGAARFLISEVVRGAGGILRDRNGTRFMTGVHESAELAPRDVVSRAILDRMVETDDTHVYLDLTAVQGNPHKLFPSISRICRSFDIDVATDPIPVRPGAHYMLGGIMTDGTGQSSLPGLFAAGEVAATGFHGANRLASNSLLEGAVLGRAAGLHAAADCGAGRPLPREVEPLLSVDNPPRIHLDDMLYSLKSLMWRQVGLKRAIGGLEEALARIGFWNHYLMRTRLDSVHALELTNMLTVSALVTNAARHRDESRGTHFRTDYPHRDDENWCRTLVQQRDSGGAITVRRLPVLSPSDQSPSGSRAGGGTERPAARHGEQVHGE